MGRIKTQFIKRLGKELMNTHKDQLKETFEENKPLVKQLLTEPSKKIRNVVAGYVTKLKKKSE